MAVAMIYPEAERGRGRKDPATKGKEILGFSQQLLMQARAVRAYSQPLAESVLSGMPPLDVAYQEAVKAKQALASDEARLARRRCSIALPLTPGWSRNRSCSGKGYPPKF